MHNGSIWRWNRPIIGFDDDGSTHLRIEHRVMAAGPSIVDEMANAAFFYGLQEYFANTPIAAEQVLSFSDSKDNFYNAAQRGISAKIKWPNLKTESIDRKSIQELVLSELLDYSSQGLASLGIDVKDCEYYLSVIESRIKSGQTGSAWQKAYLNNHSADMKQLIQAYRQNRLSGQPVHAWSV